MSDRSTEAQSDVEIHEESIRILRERVCAMVDGELDPDEVPSTISQCTIRDWSTYHLIGDVMRRSDALGPVSTTFAVRMSAALEREAAHSTVRSQATVEKRQGHGETWWRRWLSWPTAAMVAALASVVWISYPLLETEPTHSTTASLSSKSTGPVATAVLVEKKAAEPDLSDYADAHQQYASPIAMQPASSGTGGGR